MEKPLITIIVPVYKVEKYLERCVNSITNQTYKNLEIILVDDGSPDRSGEICEELAKTDSRIKVIHKENGGSSSARNAGLDVMTGEYVGFIDSDDWIEPEMYCSLYELLCSYNAQIAACGLQCNYDDGKIVYFNPSYPTINETEVFSTADAMKELILAKKITNSPCDKLFVKNVFDNRRFREGIIYEDFDLMPTLIDATEFVVYSPIPYYHYIMTEVSNTRGEIKSSRFIEADVSRKHLMFYKNKYPHLSSLASVKHIELCLDLIYASSKSKENYSLRRALISEIKRFGFSVLSDIPERKNKLKFLFFKINVSLYVFLMNSYHKNKSK